MKMSNFVEFFAGVGLVHEALSENGWNCVWANDICSEKQKTYIANFGDSNFCLGDIWDVAKSPEIIPDHAFLYTASFPCTDMSLAGSRKGFAGEESGTFHAILEIIEQKKRKNNHPCMIMFENVQGFLTSRKGMDVAFAVKELNDLGYIVDLIELDAVYFTPQSRPRVFLFAVQMGVASQVMNIKNESDILDSWWRIFDSNPELRTERIRSIIKTNSHLKWGAFDIQRPPKRQIFLHDIIEMDLNNNSNAWWSEERKNYLHSQMSALHKDVLNKIKSKKQQTFGTVFRRTRLGTSYAELRTDGIAGCLRTPRGGSSKQILIRAGFGDWSVRLLTPREYARLQGVGDDFILPENINKGYFAMGDAVCVPAIKFISSHIITPAHQKISNLPICVTAPTTRSPSTIKSSTAC